MNRESAERDKKFVSYLSYIFSAELSETRDDDEEKGAKDVQVEGAG